MVHRGLTLSTLLWSFSYDKVSAHLEFSNFLNGNAVLQLFLFMKLKYKPVNISYIEEQFRWVYVQRGCFLMSHIHFYLVQIYTIEISINGNINNITKSLWGHYTVICTSPRLEKYWWAFLHGIHGGTVYIWVQCIALVNETYIFIKYL